MSKKDKILYQYISDTQPFCQLCGNTDDLHIHHIRYGAGGRKTYIGNLIRLCGDFSVNNCHAKVHSNKKYWQPKLIKLLKSIEKRDHN